MGEKTVDQQKMSEVLKDFAANVTTSKTKERCRILGELEQLVANNGKNAIGIAIFHDLQSSNALYRYMTSTAWYHST